VGAPVFAGTGLGKELPISVLGLAWWNAEWITVEGPWTFVLRTLEPARPLRRYKTLWGGFVIEARARASTMRGTRLISF